jgi:hypothetical protein
MICSNVDRLFALFQVQNPDAYLQPSNVGQNGNVFVEDSAPPVSTRPKQLLDNK